MFRVYGDFDPSIDGMFWLKQIKMLTLGLFIFLGIFWREINRSSGNGDCGSEPCPCIYTTGAPLGASSSVLVLTLSLLLPALPRIKHWTPWSYLSQSSTPTTNLQMYYTCRFSFWQGLDLGWWAWSTCKLWYHIPARDQSLDPLIYFSAPKQSSFQDGYLRSLVPLVSITDLLYACVFYILYSPWYILNAKAFPTTSLI
jgi:hypothetical protein